MLTTYQFKVNSRAQESELERLECFAWTGASMAVEIMSVFVLKSIGYKTWPV